MDKKFAQCCVTVFGIGHFPYGAGTWASVAAALLAWPAGVALPLILLPVTFLAFALSPKAVEIYANADPQKFVLDEVCGMWLALVYLPQTFVSYAGAFALFRVFDILKPWPIRRIEKMNSSIAIVADDLAAGLAANLLMRFFIR